MDCDDQLRIVKRDDHPHPLSTDTADVCPLPVSTEFDAFRLGHDRFGIGNRRAYLPRTILGMSREAHLGLSRERANLSPVGDEPVDDELDELAGQARSRAG